MEGPRSVVDERCVVATVCSFLSAHESSMLTLIANMDDFISRWKTLNFSQQQIRNSV